MGVKESGWKKKIDAAKWERVWLQQRKREKEREKAGEEKKGGEIYVVTGLGSKAALGCLMHANAVREVASIC